MTLKDKAKSIQQRLSNLSKKHDLVYQNVATAFLLERLVVRLTSDENLSNSIVFKGGYVGLRVYDSSRYTIDVDALLVRSNIRGTLEKTKAIIQEDIGDVVWFRFEEEIDLKTQGDYGGVRQAFRGGIGEIPKNIKRAQIIHFDLGIGDPVTPGPVKVETKEMIGDKDLSWSVYPIETMIAEKIHALIDRGEFNSRSKDIFDLGYFLPKAEKENLVKALQNCFSYRETKLPEDIVAFVENINPGMLKRGWPSAVSGVKGAPSFDDAYQLFIDGLKKFF